MSFSSVPPPPLLRTSSSFLNPTAASSSSDRLARPSPGNSSPSTASSPGFPATPLVVPPLFTRLVPHVYSCFSLDGSNFSFLSSLQLRSIVYFSPETLSQQLQEWCLGATNTASPASPSRPSVSLQYRDISRFFSSSKFSSEVVKSCLESFIDQKASPILLISSPQFPYFLPILTGCLRKLQFWSFSSILEEYDRWQWEMEFSLGNSSAPASSFRFSPEDFSYRLFIELFDIEEFSLVEDKWPEWLKREREGRREEERWLEQLEDEEKSSGQEEWKFSSSSSSPRALLFSRGLFSSSCEFLRPGQKFDKKLSLVDDQQTDDGD